MEIAKLILEYVQALIWPTVVVGVLTVFRRQMEALLPRLKQAKMPGLEVDFHEALAEAKQLKKDIIVAAEANSNDKNITSTASRIAPKRDFNAEMTSRGLQPTTSGLDLGYYRTLAERDPSIALAGLRLEIEVIGKNLATGFLVHLSDKDVGAMSIFRRLLDQEAITQLQFELAKSVISLCNAAIHGEPVDKEQANAVLDVASVLVKDYIAWLSWGFPEHGPLIGNDGDGASNGAVTN